MTAAQLFLFSGLWAASTSRWNYWNARGAARRRRQLCSGVSATDEYWRSGRSRETRGSLGQRAPSGLLESRLRRGLLATARISPLGLAEREYRLFGAKWSAENWLGCRFLPFLRRPLLLRYRSRSRSVQSAGFRAPRVWTRPELRLSDCLLIEWVLRVTAGRFSFCRLRKSDEWRGRLELWARGWMAASSRWRFLFINIKD